jgi:hypothetical protein
MPRYRYEHLQREARSRTRNPTPHPPSPNPLLNIVSVPLPIVDIPTRREQRERVKSGTSEMSTPAPTYLRRTVGCTGLPLLTNGLGDVATNLAAVAAGFGWQRARTNTNCIKPILKYLRHQCSRRSTQFGGTSALCVNTRWNFRLITY